MKSVWTPGAPEQLRKRIGDVTAVAPAWGKMNAAQMLGHLEASLRMATGALPVKPKRLPLRYTPLKQLVLYYLPFPKGAPTAPELKAPPGELEENRARLIALFDEFSSHRDRTAWPEHPAFGRLDTRQWGILVWRHMDHHLRQFGV